MQDVVNPDAECAADAAGLSKPHKSLFVTAPGNATIGDTSDAADSSESQPDVRYDQQHGELAGIVNVTTGAAPSTPGGHDHWGTRVFYVCGAEESRVAAPRLMYMESDDARATVRAALGTVQPGWTQACSDSCTVCLLWLLPPSACHTHASPAPLASDRSAVGLGGSAARPRHHSKAQAGRTGARLSGPGSASLALP